MTASAELSFENIAARLPIQLQDTAWRHFTSCASTNDEAIAWAKAGAAEGAVVVADQQTAGRGRQGRSWHSPAGLHLHISMILRPPIAVNRVAPITLAAGVAVAVTLETVGIKANLKWPNDVVVGNKKIAGILAESSIRGQQLEFLVLGIGANINDEQFPADLVNQSTSIRQEIGQSVSRAQVAAELVVQIRRAYEQFLVAPLAQTLDNWSAYYAHWGKKIRARLSADQFIEGVAESLDASGHLRLRLPSGETHLLVAGEIV